MRAPQQAPSTGATQTLRGHYRPQRILCYQAAVGRRVAGELTVRAVTTHTETRTGGVAPDACDLVLSSGFLAFAGHAGFLQAVEETGLPVGGVMGTSAGALVGSLYCAGYSPRELARHLSDQTPASLLRPSTAPWRGGALSLDGVIERLRELLPPRFEDLHREFAVGVVTADGQHLLIDSGPLPEAVAASAAIPFVFQAVDVPGHAARHGPYKDGGVVDRVGLKAWRDRRRTQIKAREHQTGAAGSSLSPPIGSSLYAASGSAAVALRPPPCLVHVIDRSSPFSGLDDTSATGESHIVVVKSPRSGANFFDLGSFEEAMSAATERARPHLAAWRRQHAQHIPHRPAAATLRSNGTAAPGKTPAGPSVGPASSPYSTVVGKAGSGGTVSGDRLEVPGSPKGAAPALSPAAAAAAAASHAPNKGGSLL